MLAIGLAVSAVSVAADPVKVNAVSFIRAESDTCMRNMVGQNGGLGVLLHQRTPTPLDPQTVIHMNLDMLYSSAVVDLAAGPMTVKMPDVADGRSVALQVVNQDHLTPMVLHDGTHILTEDSVCTRYAALLVGVFIDPTEPNDPASTHAVQDGIRIEQAAAGTLDLPD
jgi:hypothetical protein